MNRRVARVDGITTRDAPAVESLLVDERVATLEVGRELQKRVVLVLNELLGDLLLDDLTAPVVLEPRLGDDLGSSAREQQGVLLAGDVEVDLRSPGKRISSGIEGSHVPCS